MENQEGKEGEGKSCGTGCGPRCGCCVCRTVKAVVLLLVGGILGYMLGKCCRSKAMCPVSGMSQPVPVVVVPAAAPVKGK